MSALLMGRVFYLPDLQPSHKLVLLALADNAHDDGRNCFPYVDTLAKKASLSRRRVQQVLADLERAGYIVRHINAATGSRGQIRPDERPNDYELSIPDLSPKAGEKGHGVKPIAPRGVKPIAPRGCSPLHPEPSLGTVNGTTTALTSSIDDSSPSVTGREKAKKERRSPASPRRTARRTLAASLVAELEDWSITEAEAEDILAQLQSEGRVRSLSRYVASSGGQEDVIARLERLRGAAVYNPGELFRDAG